MVMIADGPAGVNCGIWAKEDFNWVPKLWLPWSVDATKMLPGCLRFREDDFQYYVGTIRRKMALGDVDECGNVRINREVVTRVMAERTYTSVKRAAIDAGVIEQTAGYCGGRKSSGFKITDAYLEQPIRRVRPSDPRMIQRIHKAEKRLRWEQVARMLPVHSDLEQIQQGQLAVAPGADAILAGLPGAGGQRDAQASLTRKLRTGMWFATRSDTGRFFTPFCGLRRDIRPYVRLGGERIGGYDLRNAQPALLSIMLSLQAAQLRQCVGTYIVCAPAGPGPAGARALGSGRVSGFGGVSSALDSRGVLDLSYVLGLFGGCPDLGPDAAHFLDLTADAVFYDFMLDLCHDHGVCLDHPESDTELRRVKVLMLQDVLAKKGNYRSDFEKVFRGEFPTVHRAIRSVVGASQSRDGFEKLHGALIRALQRFESWFVLEVVCESLVDRIPVVPLHDALYGRIQDMPIIEGAFHEAFERLGLRLQIKRDVPIEKFQLN